MTNKGYWLNRRADLTTEALELWREYDRLVENRIDETDPDRRFELQEEIEQVAQAAQLVEYYALRAYSHAWQPEDGHLVAIVKDGGWIVATDPRTPEFGSTEWWKNIQPIEF